MPTFRCTRCDRLVESPVVIGAGDCPVCGGDVVFDIRGGTSGGAGNREAPARRPRSLLDRLLRR